jgi:transposase
MSAKRLSMRKIREVLRLGWSLGLSHRAIGRSCGIGHSAVAEYLKRAEKAGLRWPLSPEMDNAQLERLLFPPVAHIPSSERPLPDWSELHRELKRKGVTLSLLWEEYKAENPDGFQYSRFCELYAEWAGTLDLVMRQEHRGGEKLFVDYAGPTMPVVDRASGEVREAQLFVGVLGASSYTYAEATWTQGLADWIGSHVRLFSFLGGVPEVVVPDNLKSGVKKACFYEPDLNPTYQEMAAHYGVAVIPARVRRPRDKAKAEVGVQVAERWILGRLRKRQFFSLGELNAAILELRDHINERPFHKLPGSRKSHFEELDQPALRPLPESRYEYAEWKKVRANLDYHVEFDGHYYSVPHELFKKSLELRATAETVECFREGKRVTSHRRSRVKGGHTTLPEHMPSSHRKYASWTPGRMIAWARETGPHTAELVEVILEERPHPEQGFRSCLGIMRLAKSYGAEKVDAACERALTIKSRSYKSVRAILENNLGGRPLPGRGKEAPPIEHANVRGAAYYRTEAGSPC